MKDVIQSHIEIITINEIRSNSQTIKNNYFIDTELNEISGKHLQTLAGFYAVKVALKKIINQKYPDLEIKEKEIILSYNSTGAPCIKRIKSFQKEILNNYFISISHTAENAYGFAARMESYL